MQAVTRAGFAAAAPSCVMLSFAAPIAVHPHGAVAAILVPLCERN
jgi:hypothetical protein